MPSVVRGSDNFDSDIHQGIGVNQAWQDVTASRSVGVYYENTTGKPIQLILQVNSGTFSTLTIASASSDGTYTVFAFSYEIYIIIPPGYFYSITTASGGINKVRELK